MKEPIVRTGQPLVRRADEDGPIRSVHVLSTGSGAQHTEHRFGTRAPRLWWVLTSRSWIEIPVNAFALEHRRGLVLFDTGLNPAIASDPDYISSRLGRFFIRRLFRLHIGPDDGLDKQLELSGFSAADVRTAVISHLHFDHIGGIGDIPQAELLVSKDEWAQLSGPHPERNWILREHIELPGAKWRQIDFMPDDDPLIAPFGCSYDVMGDRSMLLLPTPGHTPGSISMLVRTAGLPPLLLVADLTYELAMLMNDRVPATGDDLKLRSSFTKVRALKRMLPDMLVLPAHDPVATHALDAADRTIH